MAHLFNLVANQWAATALAGDAFDLPGANPSLPSGVVLRRAGLDDAGWVLLAPPTGSARVNSELAVLGVRALRDRDEIQLPGQPPVFFSTEKLVAVEPYSGPVGGTCPRCTKPMAAASPAVRCASCGTWYHQNGRKDCFTYGENPICVSCTNDAVVSDGLTWVPEEL